jgi:hypothetical protein
MKTFWITSLLLASTVANAQDIPPLAPLRGDAANLMDTMKFIEEKLPGTVNVMYYTHNSITGVDGFPMKYSFALTQVAAYPNRCDIAFHSNIDVGDTPESTRGAEKDIDIPLKQVQEISLGQRESVFNLARAKAGHPEQTVKIDPPVAVVVIKSAPGFSGWMFNFYDDTLAERVFRALQHAVSLCGGGKPETF